MKDSLQNAPGRHRHFFVDKGELENLVGWTNDQQNDFAMSVERRLGETDMQTYHRQTDAQMDMKTYIRIRACRHTHRYVKKPSYWYQRMCSFPFLCAAEVHSNLQYFFTQQAKIILLTCSVEPICRARGDENR